MMVQVLILAAALFAVPFLAGGIFGGREKGCEGFLFRWVSGQMALWAGFELICVPLILTGREFGAVMRLFYIYTGAAVGLSAVAGAVRRSRRTQRGGALQTADSIGTADIPSMDAASILLWCLAAAVLALQLVLVCVLAYEEGDDAFYVSISTATEESSTMYYKLPYTGKATMLDMRHGLAPFPVWISFLARISGMKAVTLAQVALPVVLIVMSYGIYFLLGRRLFPKRSRKLPLFMVFLECLVLFGGYSVYSAENFLLVRTAQGKAVLANIVIPFLFLLFYILLESLQEKKAFGARGWFLMACAMTTGCLCSTQGALLTVMLTGVTGICALAVYRRWRMVLPMAACCVVPGGMALLYLLAGGA